MKVDPISVLLDPHSDQSATLKLVAKLARSESPPARVRILGALESIPWYARLVVPNADEIDRSSVEWLNDKLIQAATQFNDAGIKATTAVVHGKPSVEAARDAVSNHSSVIVKTFATDPNQSTIDTDLARLAPCPVLLLKDDLAETFPSKLLACVDPALAPSEADVLNLQVADDPTRDALNARILATAIDLARLNSGTIAVAHAWDVPGEDLLKRQSWVTSAQVREYVANVRQAHFDALDRLLANSSGAFQPQVEKGDPAEVIASLAARLKCDLIIMGSVAREGIPGFLLGSSAESVIRSAPCSILVLKPDGFVSPVHEH